MQFISYCKTCFFFFFSFFGHTWEVIVSESTDVLCKFNLHQDIRQRCEDGDEMTL